MKKLPPAIIVIGTLALVLIATPVILFNLVYYLVHDLPGQRNTRYTAGFSDAAFSGIQLGMPRERVIEILGTPLETTQHKDSPVWAFREEQVRNRYGRDNNIDMEVLSFSAPKNGQRDYELVHVALGPDSTVIGKSKWVTD